MSWSILQKKISISWSVLQKVSISYFDLMKFDLMTLTPL